MTIYIDLFFLFNLILDFIIVISVSIILKRRTSIKKLILSGVVGAILSLFLFTNVNKYILELLGIFIISVIAFSYINIRYLLRNIIYIYIISTLLGGILYLFNLKVSSNALINYLIILVICIEVVILYIKEMKKIKYNYNNYYKVDIVFNDIEYFDLVGFLDTGNNLYDPYKKRPIIIVNNKYKYDKKYLLVPYYNNSGDGLMKCIKPDLLYINGKRVRKGVLISFSNSPKLIDGVDVILHKDLL